MARGLFSFAILSLSLHVCLFGVVSSNHLRSLTLSWKATDESSKVDINWRFSFSRSWGSQVCDESDISNGTLIDVGEHLECQQCSNNEIARIKYQCTDYSQAEDWQTGEGSSRLTIEPGITAFDLLYSGCCWMTLGNAGAGYSAQAHVDLTQNRGVINSSPMTSWMPETRIQLGCETTLTIPMSDPDGDVVKCRWASGTNESGSVSPMPNSTLDESTCSLSIGDRLMSGWYAVALMIEDFASPMSTTAKSKIPLQFVVNVYYSYDACDERPTLIHPTPGQGSCRGASPGEIFSLQIRAKASISPILEIETSSPIGMTTSDVSLVPGKSNEYYITAMWTPDESQTGTHIFCFDALDSEGHTSEVRCINLVVGEPPKVIETSPVEGSTIPTSLGVLTFKFDQPINLISISTSVFVQSLYGMNMYTGSVTQTSPDTIQIQLSGTLYVDVAYSITLMEGTVQSRGACPFMSARHVVNVYTTWQTPAWTTDSFYETTIAVSEDGTTPFPDYWNTTPFEVVVRLVNGRFENEGRVEVYYPYWGMWGTVCDDYWDLNDARVICRMLGLPPATRAWRYAHFGQGSGSIALDDVRCNGYEYSIADCPHRGWFSHNCRHTDDAGVTCGESPTTDPGTTEIFYEMTTTVSEDGTTPFPDYWNTTPFEVLVRLVNGRFENEGRVEVYYPPWGVWGTVCDDYWDLNDARVICRMLGLPPATRAWRYAHFGQGSGNIALDDVRCYGYEYNIADCGHRGWFSHNCRHSDDAGVTCGEGLTIQTAETAVTEEGTTPFPFFQSTTSFQVLVRLVNGSFENEGRVEVYYQYWGVWGTVCDDYWDLNDARVICRMLGLPPATRAWRYAHFGQGSGYIALDNVHCSGYEYSIADCPHQGWFSHNCRHTDDAGVTCGERPTTQSPDDETTRGASPQPEVDCAESGMTVYIPRSVIGDALAYHLHFQDPTCVGSHHNATHVKIFTTYDRCGTFREIRGEKVIYFNTVYDEAVPVEAGANITRDLDIHITAQCIMDLDGMAKLSFLPDTSPINHYEEGLGTFNFSLSLYRTNYYATPYLPTDYPINFKMGDILYFEARTWSEPGLELFVQTCRATPTSNSNDFNRYTFIQDGCIEDKTLVFRPSHDSHVERFEIEVFAFIDALPQPVVYIHCDMILCNASDADSRCALGCPTGDVRSLLNMHKRRARSTLSGSRAYPITQGPISLAKEGGKEASSGLSSVQLPILLTTVCLLVGCVLVLGTLVVMMRKRSKRLAIYQPLAMDVEE